VVEVQDALENELGTFIMECGSAELSSAKRFAKNWAQWLFNRKHILPIAWALHRSVGATLISAAISERDNSAISLNYTKRRQNMGDLLGSNLALYRKSLLRLRYEEQATVAVPAGVFGLPLLVHSFDCTLRIPSSDGGFMPPPDAPPAAELSPSQAKVLAMLQTMAPVGVESLQAIASMADADEGAIDSDILQANAASPGSFVEMLDGLGVALVGDDEDSDDDDGDLSGMSVAAADSVGASAGAGASASLLGRNEQGGSMRFIAKRAADAEAAAYATAQAGSFWRQTPEPIPILVHAGKSCSPQARRCRYIDSGYSG